MTASQPRSYVLERFMQCQHCGSPMLVDLGEPPNADVYRRSRSNNAGASCAAPDIRALLFETRLIQELTEAVMTPQNMRRLQRHLASTGEYSSNIDFETITDLARDPLTYIAKDSRESASLALSNFVHKITLWGTVAEIRYDIPLPQDSPLPGAIAQTVTMPAEVLI